MTECVNRNAYNEKGAECSEVQIERLLQHFGPTLQRDLALRYNPAQCKKTLYFYLWITTIKTSQLTILYVIMNDSMYLRFLGHFISKIFMLLIKDFLIIL